MSEHTQNANDAGKSRADIAAFTLAEYNATSDHIGKTLQERETTLKYYFQTVTLPATVIGMFGKVGKDEQPLPPSSARHTTTSNTHGLTGKPVFTAGHVEMSCVFWGIFIVGVWSLLKYQLEAQYARELFSKRDRLKSKYQTALGGDTEHLVDHSILPGQFPPLTNIAEYGTLTIGTINSMVAATASYFLFNESIAALLLAFCAATLTQMAALVVITERRKCAVEERIARS